MLSLIGESYSDASGESYSDASGESYTDEHGESYSDVDIRHLLMTEYSLLLW